MPIGNNVTYVNVNTVYKSGKYRVIKQDASTLSGQAASALYDVEDIEEAMYLASFITQQEAIDFVNQRVSPADKPNLANTKSSGGTTRETNPPKVPNKASNSSISYQQNGPSLSKPAQGVIANTIISINNSIPAHGCDIKLPVLFEGIQTSFKKFVETETSNLTKFATWLSTDVISPIVEAIKNAIKAVKDRIKQIQKYIDKIKKIVTDIKEFIQEVQEVIAFIMSLPAKLMQLVANCLAALQSGLTTMIKSAVDADSAAASATTDSATKTNATDSKYSSVKIPTVTT